MYYNRRHNKSIKHTKRVEIANERMYINARQMHLSLMDPGSCLGNETLGWK